MDVLFVYIVYIKTKMCMKSRKRKKSKALVAMVCTMKQKKNFISL